MSLDTVLQAAVVKPVIVGYLDIKDSPLRGWSGAGAFAPTETGDDDLDGNTFVEAEGAVDISDFAQDMGIGKPVTVTFSAGEFDDEDVVQQLIADRRLILGRKAKFWRFLMLDDESGVHPDFDVIFSGVMTGASSTRQSGQAAQITITCDQDLQNAQIAPLRWIDHQFFFPGDTASTFINDLSRGPIASAHVPASPESHVYIPSAGYGMDPNSPDAQYAAWVASQGG